mgnify:CR=1 FL=1
MRIYPPDYAGEHWSKKYWYKKDSDVKLERYISKFMNKISIPKLNIIR